MVKKNICLLAVALSISMKWSYTQETQIAPFTETMESQTESLQKQALENKEESVVRPTFFKRHKKKFIYAGRAVVIGTIGYLACKHLFPFFAAAFMADSSNSNTAKPIGIDIPVEEMRSRSSRDINHNELTHLQYDSVHFLQWDKNELSLITPEDLYIRYNSSKKDPFMGTVHPESLKNKKGVADFIEYLETYIAPQYPYSSNPLKWIFYSSGQPKEQQTIQSLIRELKKRSGYIKHNHDLIQPFSA